MWENTLFGLPWDGSKGVNMRLEEYTSQERRAALTFEQL